MAQDDRLNQIFIHQQQLMNGYHKIIRDGPVPYITASDLPLNLDYAPHQLILKHTIYCILEEVSEVLSTTTTVNELREEMIDILHFLVELCILSGLAPASLIRDDEYFPDVLYELFLRTSPRVNYRTALSNMLTSLGCAGHELKNRPWRQTHTPTAISEYFRHVRRAFSHYIHAAKDVELDHETLFTAYINKNKINQQRQENSY